MKPCPMHGYLRPQLVFALAPTSAFADSIHSECHPFDLYSSVLMAGATNDCTPGTPGCNTTMTTKGQYPAEATTRYVHNSQSKRLPCSREI